jgi:putative oxidoreductase
MNLLHRLELWGEQHHPRWLDYVRIGLGIFLVIKGIQFLFNLSYLLGRVSDNVPVPQMLQGALAYYVFAAHLLGGIMLILGAYTRLAALIQIPILIGAIFFVKGSGNLFSPLPELYIAIIVLLLLIYFLITGNNSWEALTRPKMVRKPREKLRT